MYIHICTYSARARVHVHAYVRMCVCVCIKYICLEKIPIMSCGRRALSSFDPHYIPIFRVRADDTVVVAIDVVVVA